MVVAVDVVDAVVVMLAVLSPVERAVLSELEVDGNATVVVIKL